MQVENMLKTHPNRGTTKQDLLARCIEACFTCAESCTSCADACLAEDMVADLRHCISTDLSCADICEATGRVLSRQTQPDWKIVRAQLEACITATQRCAAECEKHQDMHEHCKMCAQACRTCEETCKTFLASAPN